MRASPVDGLDSQQFEDLFRSHFDDLCRFARQFVYDHDAAQEVVQKIFISFWENRANIDPAQSMRAYLFRSVRNRSLNYLRDHKKFRSELLDIECADFITPMEEPDFELDELRQKIQRALDSLPSKCREVFEKSRNQEMKYREIAEEMNISVKTVEVHMSKALKILREKLGVFWLFIYLLHGL